MSLTAALNSNMFKSSSTKTKKVSLFPGKFDKNSCGLSITSLGSVKIVSLAGSSKFTSIDFEYSDNFAIISGDECVSMQGLKIKNGRNFTGCGLKIENVLISDRVSLSDVVV